MTKPTKWKNFGVFLAVFVALVVLAELYPCAGVIINVFRHDAPHAKEYGEAARALAETLALVGAFLFFTYKAIVGYHYVDLNLSIATKRWVDGKGEKLAVTAKLKKGSRGSIRLHDLQAKVSPVIGAEQRSFEGIHRLSFQEHKDEHRRCTALWEKSESEPLLRLPPDEEAEFAIIYEIPTNAVCMVEVVAMGKEVFWGGLGQWRGSHVSMPDTGPTAKESAKK